LAHQCRRGQRDPELWNRAADLAINPILIANGLKLPGDALIDPGFNNLSAEEIYARLARPNSGTSSSDSSQGQPQSGPGAATDGSQQRNDGSGLDHDVSSGPSSSSSAAQSGQVPDVGTNAATRTLSSDLAVSGK
jgi:hypothetical protein